MSILTETPPGTVEIGGQSCPIRTDFKVWIQFAKLAEENDMGTPDRLVQIIKLVYGYLPPRLDEAVSALLWFYGAGHKPKPGTTKTDAQERIFDYEADAEYIYAAFLTQYNIDLSTASLHWWKFKALMSALDESTQFMKILGYRSVELSKIKDKEQRGFYRRMQKMYALPDMRTDEEKDVAVVDALQQLF